MASPVASPPLAERAQLDRLSLLGQLATSMAHELSKPLSAIVASAQTALAFPGSSTDGHTVDGDAPHESHRPDLELILTEARRAGEVVESLLALARVHPPERRPIAMHTLVARVAALVRHHLVAHDVRLDVPEADHPGALADVRVIGDSDRLQQILLSLIVNAQQAITETEIGSCVAVRLSAPDPEHLEVVVEDDGPGVPTSLRESIFEPFFTTRADGVGTGLGLTIVTDVAHAHAGEIRVEDRPGGGARFVIRLPAQPAPAGHAGSADEVAGIDDRGTTASRPARVLLVDDEPGILNSVGRFLRACGYDVDAVSAGEAAIDALAAAEFDVVISDLRMPGLSGEDFYDVVRDRFPAMASRIVFTSGDMMREETRTFIERTGCPSLGKPYELTDMVDLIGDLCAATTGHRPS